MTDPVTDLETLFDKIRIPKSWGLKQLLKELTIVLGILFLIAIGFFTFGTIEYFAFCYSDDHPVTVMQCFRRHVR